MGKTPRQKLRAISQIMPEFTAELLVLSKDADLNNRTEEHLKETLRILRHAKHALNNAFKKLNLDISNDDHWRLATFLMASALYGKRAPGRKTTWTRTKLKQLLKDFENKRRITPHMNETQICRELEKLDQYKNVHTEGALRRQLQFAKKL